GCRLLRLSVRLVRDDGGCSSILPVGCPSLAPNPRYRNLDGCSLGYPLRRLEGQEEVTAYSGFVAVQLSFSSAIVFSCSLRVEKPSFSQSRIIPKFSAMTVP